MRRKKRQKQTEERKIIADDEKTVYTEEYSEAADYALENDKNIVDSGINKAKFEREYKTYCQRLKRDGYTSDEKDEQIKRASELRKKKRRNQTFEQKEESNCKRRDKYLESETKAREIEITSQQNKEKERKSNRRIQRRINKQEKISRRFRKAYTNQECNWGKKNGERMIYRDEETSILYLFPTKNRKYKNKNFYTLQIKQLSKNEDWIEYKKWQYNQSEKASLSFEERSVLPIDGIGCSPPPDHEPVMYPNMNGLQNHPNRWYYNICYNQSQNDFSDPLIRFNVRSYKRLDSILYFASRSYEERSRFVINGIGCSYPPKNKPQLQWKTIDLSVILTTDLELYKFLTSDFKHCTKFTYVRYVYDYYESEN